jgi:hypothetical protein
MLNLQLNRNPAAGLLRVRGDSAYPTFEAICSYIKGQNLTAQDRFENHVYKIVRESIEWGYGTTAALFKYLQNLQKLQLMKGDKVKKVYTVATILRNCHVILYGGQTSSFFGVGTGQMPNLQQYLRQM